MTAPTIAESRTWYTSDVEFETPDGQMHKLSLIFEGGVTDYYWNSSTARDFYAAKIEAADGNVTGYGVRGLDGRLLNVIGEVGA